MSGPSPRPAPARLLLATAWLLLPVALLAAPRLASAQTTEPPVVLEPPPPAEPAPAPAPAPPPAPAPAATPAPAAPARPPLATLSGAARQDAEPGNVHGLGFAGSFTFGSGFAYRRYFGESALQINGIAIISDRGDESLVFGGLSYIKYLTVWSSGGIRSLVPSTTALRLIGGTTFYHQRRKVVEPDDSQVPPDCSPFQNCTGPLVTKKDVDTVFGFGGGVGFEFGAVQRPGFSLSLDLMLTAAFDEVGGEFGLWYILPLPAMTLMYSW